MGSGHYKRGSLMRMALLNPATRRGEIAVDFSAAPRRANSIPLRLLPLQRPPQRCICLSANSFRSRMSQPVSAPGKSQRPTQAHASKWFLLECQVRFRFLRCHTCFREFARSENQRCFVNSNGARSNAWNKSFSPRVVFNKPDHVSL